MSGIHAHETLFMKIKNEIQLVGAKITIGDQAKPLPARIEGGKTSPYHYPQVMSFLNLFRSHFFIIRRLWDRFATAFYLQTGPRSISDIESIGLKLKGLDKKRPYMEFIDHKGKVRVKIHPPDRTTSYVRMILRNGPT